MPLAITNNMASVIPNDGMLAASVMPSVPTAMTPSPATRDRWYPIRSISLAEGIEAKK